MASQSDSKASSSADPQNTNGQVWIGDTIDIPSIGSVKSGVAKDGNLEIRQVGKQFFAVLNFNIVTKGDTGAAPTAEQQASGRIFVQQEPSLALPTAVAGSDTQFKVDKKFKFGQDKGQTKRYLVLQDDQDKHTQANFTKTYLVASVLQNQSIKSAIDNFSSIASAVATAGGSVLNVLGDPLHSFP